MPKNSKEKPVHEIRLGRIKSVIWHNENKEGDAWYNVQVRRIYKEKGGGGDWKSSDSFGRDDLPLVAKVADLSHSWIYEQTQAQD